MGTWTIIDRVEPQWTTGVSTGGDEVCIFAPSLRELTPGSPIVMATLPVLDWNGELFRALSEVTSAGNRCYAAVLMIDPFTLWEDLTDLLKDKGFAGVVNFPPASLIEGMQTAGLPVPGNTLEIDRLKWFHEAGLRIAYTGSSMQEMTDVGHRLDGLLEGMIYFPPEALIRPVAARMDLEHVTEALLPATVWSLKPVPASPAVEAV